MKNKILLITALSWCIAASAIAAPNSPSTGTDRSKPKSVLYCPAIKNITKNPHTLTWSADQGNYKSYDMSFATSLFKFTGAQWVGATVGQMTCVYSTRPKTSFPVLLIFHTLTHQPEGDAWSKNLGGYLNCNSLKRKSCPFRMLLKRKSGDIYKEAEKLKRNNSAPQPPTE